MQDSSYLVDKYWNGAKGTSYCEDAKPIPAVVGETFEGLNFVITTSGTVAGQVVDNVTGQGVGGMVVNAYADACGGNVLATTFTDNFGNFFLNHLENTSVYLMAFQSDYELNPWWMTGWYNTKASLIFDCTKASSFTVKMNQDLGGAKIVLTNTFDYMTQAFKTVKKNNQRAIKAIKAGKMKVAKNARKVILASMADIKRLGTKISTKEVSSLTKNIKEGINKKKISKLQKVNKKINKLLKRYV